VLFKLQPCSETRADCKFSGQGVFPLEPELPLSGGSTLNKAKLLCCNVVVTQVYCRHTLLRHRTAVSNNEPITKFVGSQTASDRLRTTSDKTDWKLAVL
jgi:hypothetical protein